MSRELLIAGIPDLDPRAFSKQGKSMRLYKGGGGGGGSTYYGNLDALYAQQAEQAKLLGDVAKTTVVPGYNKLMQEANATGGVAEQNLNASRAGQDARAAIGGQREEMQRNMASMGINPMDERFVRGMMGNEAGNAAMVAGVQNSERNRVKDMGFARRQDSVSLGLGLPSQASAAFGNAAGGYQNIINSQVQQQQASQSAIGNAVGGAIGAYGLYKSFADGGYVSRSSKDGAPKFASGGIISGGAKGFMAPVSAPAAPPTGRSQYVPSTAERAVGAGAAGMQGAALGKTAGAMVADGVGALGNATGSVGMQQFAGGMESGQGLMEAINNYKAAQSAVEGAYGIEAGASGLGLSAPAGSTAILGAETAGAAAGAEALGAGVAATEGAALGAAAGGSSAAGLGAMAGAALPWVGGAVLASEALGLTDWFADGGLAGRNKMGIQDRVDGEDGGEVDGPGGPTDDKIPAWLSDGEYVLNADAVRHFGLDRLEKMNQVGLDLRYGKRGMSRKKGESNE